MELKLIYKNNYGATFKVKNSINNACEVQMIIDSIGLFMSKKDLENLLDIVKRSYEPCEFMECIDKYDRIFCTNPLLDICLKFNSSILKKMEDLINGTLFIMNLDSTFKDLDLTTKDS